MRESSGGSSPRLYFPERKPPPRGLQGITPSPSSRQTGRISEEIGRSYAQISLNWLLRQHGVTSPIIGARTLEQLEDNLGASGWELIAEQVNELSETSAL